jgi:GTP-binding protein LepA
MSKNYRNFVIISHVDHGKSTLADRFLELTKTIEPRQMKPQFLDRLESERERGITIKMAPVRMLYSFNHIDGKKEEYILNLIDTPGHSDFSYEVSRALAAVEGAILLVDASQGIEAQTFTNLRLAQKAGLIIIGAVNKIDLFTDNPDLIEKKVADLAKLLNTSQEKIFRISGKTGQGVPELLRAVVEFIPPPLNNATTINLNSDVIISRSLVFDSLYDEHKGIIAFVRVFDGEFMAGQTVQLMIQNFKFKVKEVGYFMPDLKAASSLKNGEIGYIVTGIKNPDILKIGDTIITDLTNLNKDIKVTPLSGYYEPKAVIFVSLYPDQDEDYEDLKQALQKLKLNDPSLTFDSDFNEVLGRGFKCGFLGQLHFEIVVERLEKEFGIKVVSTFPSVAYKVKINPYDEYKIIKNVDELPHVFFEILEPIIQAEIITPPQFLGNILKLKEVFRMKDIKTNNLGERVIINAKMPLNSLISDFDGQLKSVSCGMASFSYEIIGEEKAEMEKVEILVAGEPIAGLSRLIYKDQVETESRKLLLKLKNFLPRQQFSQALQAKTGSRIVAREDIPALRKDVTGYLYGGDRSRKIKLWKKQKEGKKKLKALGKVTFSASIFKELLKK